MSALNKYKRMLLTIDDFYADPDAVRTVALDMEYFVPKGLQGLRSREQWYPDGTRDLIEKIVGCDTEWVDNSEAGHGCFYRTDGTGIDHEVPSIHFDSPPEDITVLVYLTPDLPHGCGTSLFQHKATGLMRAPTEKEAKSLGWSRAKLVKQLDQVDGPHRDRWIETDRIGYRYNRAVFFSSGYYHAATSHFGHSIATSRIYQVFRLGVDWNYVELKGLG